MVIRLPIEIEEKDLMKHLEKAVYNYLDERAMLGFIREEIKRVFTQSKRLEANRAIGELKARFTKMETKVNNLEEEIRYIRRKLKI